MGGAGKGSANKGPLSVFVIGFEYDTDEYLVKKHFGKVGRISSVYFQSNKTAVVAYERADSAGRAVEELNGSYIQGQERYVSVKYDERAQPPPAKASAKGGNQGGKGGSKPSGYSIYVSGFEPKTDDVAIKKHFGKAGYITDLYFKSTGSVVVTYDKVASARRAVKELDGSYMKGQERYVAAHVFE